MDGVDSVCCPGRFTHICHRQTHTSTSQPFRSMAHLSFPLFTVCMTVPNTVWLRLFYMHILSSYTEEASVQWLNEVREEFDWTGLDLPTCCSESKLNRKQQLLIYTEERLSFSVKRKQHIETVAQAGQEKDEIEQRIRLSVLISSSPFWNYSIQNKQKQKVN